MDDNERLGIGGNNPPKTTADELAERFAEDVLRADELIAAYREAPAKVESEETAEKIAELVKSIRASKKRLGDAADQEAAPSKQKTSEILGFFNKRLDLLEEARAALLRRNKEFQDARAAAERLRLQREEDERRRIAAEKLALAKDAEDTKNAAIKAQQQAVAAAEEAAKAKQAAQSEQELAAAAVISKKADFQRIRAEASAIAARYAKMKAAGEPINDAERQALKSEFEGKLDLIKGEIAKADDDLRQARDRAIAAREEARKAEEARRQEAAAAKSATREADHALGEAVREELQADKLSAKLQAAPSDMARVRSEHGAVGVLQRHWVCEVSDKTKLDKEALWPFIHEEAIESALWKWMRQQPPEKRQMSGATIFEDTVAQVR